MNKHPFRALFVILTMFLSVPSAFASRGVTPEDYFAFHFLSDAHISPNGKQVAYVLTVVNEAKNRRESSIWMVAVDGHSEPRRLTEEGLNSNSPRWSPDGNRLAFLSSRSADGSASAGGPDAPRPQIWILPMSGGEAQVLTQLKNGISAFQWSPDGKQLVAVGRSGPSDAVPAAARKSDVRHYKNISYKYNDTGWYDDKRTHLWVIDAVNGRDKQITSGDQWNDSDPQWSPDGTRIAFVSNRTGHEYDGDLNKDVWVIPAEGGGPLTKISDHPFDDDLAALVA